jgi:glycine betaine/choline ABC-type transport system substrate-binding protein
LALFADAVLGAVEGSRRPVRAMLFLAGAILLSLALLHQGRNSPGSVVIGSKNFTEQVLLGEILAARLEERGFPVDRRLNLGGTTLCHEAVRTGAIDAYVEYSGTALTDVLKEPATADPTAALGIVRDRYRGLGLLVGAPLGFNNTFALVVRPEDAAAGLRRISDLAGRAASLRVALFGEFLERADGLPGLQRAYGFRLGVRPIEMDLGLLYTALEKRQVDLVVGSATDGQIAARGFVVLEDDRAYFPPYDAFCVMNARSVTRHPGLDAAVASLAGRIDAATMRRLNHAVDGEHRAAADVAREFVRGLPPQPFRRRVSTRDSSS